MTLAGRKSVKNDRPSTVAGPHPSLPGDQTSPSAGSRPPRRPPAAGVTGHRSSALIGRAADRPRPLTGRPATTTSPADHFISLYAGNPLKGGIWGRTGAPRGVRALTHSETRAPVAPAETSAETGGAGAPRTALTGTEAEQWAADRRPGGCMAPSRL